MQSLYLLTFRRQRVFKITCLKSFERSSSARTLIRDAARILAGCLSTNWWGNLLSFLGPERLFRQLLDCRPADPRVKVFSVKSLRQWRRRGRRSTTLMDGCSRTRLEKRQLYHSKLHGYIPIRRSPWRTPSTWIRRMRSWKVLRPFRLWRPQSSTSARRGKEPRPCFPFAAWHFQIALISWARGWNNYCHGLAQ